MPPSFAGEALTLTAFFLRNLRICGNVVLLKGKTCRGGGEGFREIVIFQDETAKRSHQELFSLHDTRYLKSGESMVHSIEDAMAGGFDRLHVSAGWEEMLKIAFWTSRRPSLGEVMSLLRKSGAGDDDLQPFRESDINDFFPWLYYGRRFDILKRVCGMAKARIEARMENRMALVYCHLSANETRRIVASSL